MQKITVRNFGPLKQIEDLPLQNLMVFIGPQASGKSTLAKLIYYFKSVKEEIIGYLEKVSPKKNKSQLIAGFSKDLRENRLPNKLNLLFGEEIYQSNSFVSFEYAENLRITVEASEANSWKISLSQALEDGLFGWIPENNHLSQLEEPPVDYFPPSRFSRPGLLYHNLTQFLKDTEQLYYIPAGRSLLSAVNNALKSRFFERLNSVVDFQSDTRQRNLYFDWLTLRYMDILDQIKSQFLGKDLPDWVEKKINQLKSSFEGIDGVLPGPNYQLASDLLSIRSKIMHGELWIDENGQEWIEIESGKKIRLEFASSGQQETAGIFLILYNILINRQESTLIIEEPEAHLYPQGQKEICDALALVKNMLPENQVIITTHSPYILTALDTLIQAYKIAHNNPMVKEKIISHIGIKETVWLNYQQIGAYFLDNGTITPINNPERQGIGGSPIDTVSEDLGEQFDQLLDLDYESARE